MLDFEKSYYSDTVMAIVGVDEAGRGPLAGPVCAAAAILPSDYQNDLINDSKQLTAKQRDALYDEIKAHALSYGIAFATAEEIDRMNIYAATQKAMKEAIAQLNVPYQLILTDAMPLRGLSVPVGPIKRMFDFSISTSEKSRSRSEVDKGIFPFRCPPPPFTSTFASAASSLR